MGRRIWDTGAANISDTYRGPGASTGKRGCADNAYGYKYGCYYGNEDANAPRSPGKNMNDARGQFNDVDPAMTGDV